MGKECNVCLSPASFTCQNCVQAHYCDKSHQREDWPKHKLACAPFLIAENEVLGRHLVASRDLRQGELILKEDPLITGPRVGSSPLCVSCYRTLPDEKPRACSRCHKAWVCSRECESAPSLHAIECETIKDHPRLIINAQWILPLRCYLSLRAARDGSTSASPRWQELMNLEAHHEERRGSVRWKIIERYVVQELENAGIALNEAELLQKICGILDVNSFEIRGPESSTTGQFERLKGIYLRASLMAHSCVANTHLAMNNAFQLVLRAAVPISKSETISFNYTGPIKGTTERLDMLQEEKYFICHCKRCSDPSELGTHMDSLMCPRCYKNGIMTKNRTDGCWSCANCEKVLDDNVVRTTIFEARRVMEELDLKNQKVLENLLSRFARTFHANHAVMIDLKQMLIERYRTALLVDVKPCKKLLKKKINLCQQILPVVEAIEPGISRLKGLTLYAYHLSVALLGNREYEAREITRKELIARLERAEALLKEATFHLSYEPSDSPEGLLAKQAGSALQCLQDTITETREEEREQELKDARRKGGKRK